LLHGEVEDSVTRKLMLLTVLAASLTGCGLAFEVDTVIQADESGILAIAVGFAPPDGEGEEFSCDFESLPAPGATIREEMRDGLLWCVATMPFENMEQLRLLYSSLGEGAILVDCLAFQTDRLIYDVRLVSEGASDEGESIVMPWRVTTPGHIASTNADEVTGETLSWFVGDSVGERSLQVNVGEDGLCPTDLFLVQLLVLEDGTGTATIQAPTLPTGEDDTQLLIGALSQGGWQVDPPAKGAASFEARRSWNSESEFQAIAQSIPPLADSATEFNLSVQEDSATGLLRFDFRGRVDLGSYAAYWQTINSQLEPPPFRFDYSPPGTLDSTSGNWTDNITLELRWAPGPGPASFPLRAISVIEPLLEEEVEQGAAARNLETIKSRFLDEIPVGQITTDPSFIQRTLMNVFSPGLSSNMTNWTKFSCGDFQTRTLAWLDSIRTHPDPEMRAQLAGLDYGPVQAYRGGHQAVVIFPRDTDWQDTGTVLDPWPNQRPETLTMEQWGDRFSWGIGVGEGGGRYPQMFGNPPAYPGSTVPRERLHPRRIGVNSPVGALVMSADGRRLGMLPDGTFINEIEGADFYPIPKHEGEFQWYFGLPEGSYEMTLTGTAEGEVHVIVGDENNQLVTYGPQAIQPGQSATLMISPNTIDHPLQTPGGQAVEPIAVNESNVGDIDFGEPVNGISIALEPAVRTGYLAVLFLCTWGPATAIWAVVSMRIARRRTGRER
jgi:hypothetical protein